MNRSQFIHGAKFWIWVVLFVAYSAGAVGVVLIDTYEDRYREMSKVKLTTVNSDADTRRAGASQVAAIYRAQSGAPFATLQPGASFQIVWPDGSVETVTVMDPSSPLGAEPVKGTAVQAE